MNETPTGSASDGTAPAHLDDDVLLNLMLGLLSEEQERPVFAHLEACPQCERALQALCARHALTRAAGSPRFLGGGELIRAEQPDVAKVNPAHPKWAAVLLRRPAIAIAGAVITVLLIVVLWPRPTPMVSGPPGVRPAPGIEWLTTRDVGRQVREAGGGGSLAEFDAALDAYASRDLPRALELLTAARVPESVEAYRRVFLGSALALNGHYAEAARILRDAAEPELRDPLRLEAYKTLCAALSLSGRPESADSLLRALEDHPSSLGAWARGMLRSAEPQ